MCWIDGGKAALGCSAGPSQMGHFETQWLAADTTLSALTDLSGRWMDLVHKRRPRRGIVLDMDSSVSPTHSEQEMSACNGHYQCTAIPRRSFKEGKGAIKWTRLSCLTFATLSSLKETD